MNSTHRTRFTLWLAASLSGVAFAGPLERGLVEKEARWVVHIDAEAVRASTVGPAIRELVESIDTHSRERIRKELGFDPSTEVLGITIFGRGYSGDDGIAVLTTTAEADKMDAGLSGAGLSEHRVVEVEGARIHSWTIETKPAFAVCLPARDDPSRRRVLFSGSLERIQQGINVARGAAPSQSHEPPKGVLATEPTPGGMFFAAADGLSENVQPDAGALRGVETVLVQMGEAAESDSKWLVGSVRLQTSDAERATNVQQVLNGMLAMATMAGQDTEELRPLVQAVKGVKVSLEDRDVRINARHSSVAAAAMLRQLIVKIKAAEEAPAAAAKPGTAEPTPPKGGG